MAVTKTHNILIVENDSNLRKALTDYLTINNYKITCAVDGRDGLLKFKNHKLHLVILDVMLPIKDGFTLAKEMKRLKPELPIVFLTEKSMKDDMIKGYEIGADDFINKPFDTELLLIKIKAILQSYSLNTQNINVEFKIGKYVFDSRLRQLVIKGDVKKLSPKENDLLKLLSMYKNDLMPRDLALTRIWNEDTYFTSRSMDVYIAKLRKYLKADESVKIINVHGEGFRLMEEM
ncbi:MAG: response regulator transcription factor [Ichthyobacteriaceae bacterium]|nr:response regulator transcription factor [Ichthyobacteriaceae bacterium]